MKKLHNVQYLPLLPDEVAEKFEMEWKDATLNEFVLNHHERLAFELNIHTFQALHLYDGYNEYATVTFSAIAGTLIAATWLIDIGYGANDYNMAIVKLLRDKVDAEAEIRNQANEIMRLENLVGAYSKGIKEAADMLRERMAQNDES